MGEYYFLSQLPSLDGIGDNSALPITEDRFLELCYQYLGKKAKNEIANLTLTPPRMPEKSYSAVLEKWYEGERKLRIALAKSRAEKMKKKFDLDNEYLPTELSNFVKAVMENESPLEAEKLLNSFRLDFLETLRPMDNFSEEAVFYYGLKLKLLHRIRRFDTDIGSTAYKNIYKSIIDGDRLEDVK